MPPTGPGADQSLDRFEKSLYDLIRGLRSHKGNERQYMLDSLKECRNEAKSQDIGVHFYPRQKQLANVHKLTRCGVFWRGNRHQSCRHTEAGLPGDVWP